MILVIPLIRAAQVYVSARPSDPAGSVGLARTTARQVQHPAVNEGLSELNTYGIFIPATPSEPLRRIEFDADNREHRYQVVETVIGGEPVGIPLFLDETAELVCSSEPPERFPPVNVRATLLLWVYGPRVVFRDRVFAYGNAVVVGEDFVDGAPPKLLDLLFDRRTTSVAVAVEGSRAPIAGRRFENWTDAHAYLTDILAELGGVVTDIYIGT